MNSLLVPIPNRVNGVSISFFYDLGFIRSSFVGDLTDNFTGFFFLILYFDMEEKDVKAPNIIERGKEEIEALFHHDKKPHHHKETHGRSDDIDENTAVDDVKGPNVFERVKEEVEAIVGAIHPKKESKGP
ncbi:hypothetical protein PVK06_033642 [Gossypium arboreum]|uniref:Uncharacterized protein n=1 Tax=Gossypium arboreum TaxID=29729 RepID=A0ABR0NCV5_GOSAR|nr:hypothetical protein PVK06_033642 [Gossypium arboreum]